MKSDNSIEQLIQAVKNKDGILFDRIFREWAETIQLNDAILSQANTFRQSLYGKGEVIFDEHKFISEINGANKQKIADSSKVLASL